MDVRRAAMFLTVGGCGYVLNTVIVYLLHGHLGITAASTIATEAAITANFLGHTYWTFAERSDHRAAARPGADVAGHLHRFWRFQLASLLAASVTVATLTVIHDAAIPLAVSNLLAVAAGSGLNFAISSNLIWRGEPHPEARTAT